MYRIPIYQVKLVRDGSQSADRKKVSTPAIAASILQEFLDGADREHFIVLLLDTQNQLIGLRTVTVGTLDASLVHPREVFKPAILLAHSHPSGDPTPSAENRAVTRQLAAACAALGIEVLDHITIGDVPRYVSLVEAGPMETATPAGRASA